MADPAGIAAVILAAGRSRRFGSDKLLHPVTLHGIRLPVAAHSLGPWLDVFEQVTVVVGPSSQPLRHAMKSALQQNAGRIRWVTCADADSGMGHSLACGIAANARASGWLVGLADMPSVPQSAISGVLQGLCSGAALAAPYKNDRRGHPVGFASIYRDTLMALQGDAGARTLLQQESKHILRTKTDDDGIFTDVDSPQDLEKLCGHRA